MMAAVPRALMALAVRSMGAHRRTWGEAMEAELEAAREDGKPLLFALGCLAAAWRELPAHEEGRFAIASHLVAFLLIVPAAALAASTMLADFASSGAVSEANRAALPSLAALLLVLAGAHLRMAWLVLERDWTRLAPAAALAAAATTTLVLFAAVVFGDFASAPLRAAALAAELGCVAALARWHGCAFAGVEAPT
ncbi:MAG TPA: hypothetical protein VGB08_05815 [Allosphingosinicella sp.]|jgi:hypothetical protein